MNCKVRKRGLCRPCQGPFINVSTIFDATFLSETKQPQDSRSGQIFHYLIVIYIAKAVLLPNLSVGLLRMAQMSAAEESENPTACTAKYLSVQVPEVLSPFGGVITPGSTSGRQNLTVSLIYKERNCKKIQPG